MSIKKLVANAKGSSANSKGSDIKETVNSLIDAVSFAEELKPNAQYVLSKNYVDVTLPSPYSANTFAELRQDLRDWITARGEQANWEAMTTTQRAVSVHPSVVALKSRWNGYQYWCLFTPYPNSNSAFENPCLAASNDLINWVVPDGVLNPIDSPASTSTSYMRDTHLFFDDIEQRLCMMYLERGNGFNKLYVKTYNGITVSPRYEIWSGVLNTNDFASPSFWFNPKVNKWQAIGHNLDNAAWPIVKMESDTLESGWGSQTTLSFPTYAGRKWWHSSFHLASDNKTIFGLIQDNNGTGGAGGNIYYCQSADFLNFSADLNYFSQAGMYRGCIVAGKGFLISKLGDFMRLITGDVGYMNRGAQVNQIIVNATTTPNASNVIAADNFNRADSATLGTSSSGATWTNIDANTIGIVSNAASGVNGQSCRATLDAGKNSYTVSCILKNVGSECNIYLRFVDANNCLRFRTHLRQLDQVVAGSVTLIKQLDCKPLTGASSAVITAIVSPSNIKILIDGVCYCDVDTTTHSAATKAGLQISGATTSTVDAFSITSDAY